MGKIIAGILFAIVISVSAYLLWQRQPKGQLPQPPSASESATQQETVDTTPKLIETPLNNSVNSPNIKFAGNSILNTFVAIYSNDMQSVTKTDNAGKYQKDQSPPKGLNFISAQAFNSDLTPDKNQSINIYVSDNPNGNTVFAGVVKTTFENALTVTTTLGDKDIKTSKTTKFETPKEEKIEATTTAEDLIRIGDYVIALGNSKDGKVLDAQSLEIIRNITPHNTELLAPVKITTGVSQNSFTAANIADGKSIQFNLDKSTSISKEEKSAASKDIAKDKRGFIFYHTEGDKNIADLVYLLP